MNVLFAFLFWLGGDCIANARPGSLVDLFFFSIETLATVGYGDMHPQNIYGHSIATVEIFTGMSTLAVFTGLIFARFSRPRARVIFADFMTLAQHDGQPTLMARFVNARRSSVNEARAEIWLIYRDATVEGVGYRRFRQTRPETVAQSDLRLFLDAVPCRGRQQPDLRPREPKNWRRWTPISWSISSASTTCPARMSMSARAIPGATSNSARIFADILVTGEDGVPRIDYRKLNVAEPQDSAAED